MRFWHAVGVLLLDAGLATAVLMVEPGDPFRVAAGLGLVFAAPVIAVGRAWRSMGVLECAALAWAGALAGTALLAGAAGALGVRLTVEAWVVIALATSIAMLAVAEPSGTRLPRPRMAVRPGPLVLGVAAALVCVAAIAVTAISVEDARESERFVALGATVMDPSHVEVQLLSRQPGTVRYVLQLGHGAALDERAAVLDLPYGASVSRRLRVPPGRGVVRVTVRRDSLTGPMLHRLDVSS